MSFKKCQVVMLPTKERAKKGELTLFGDELIIASSVLHLAQVSQHLYILSDEEAKEGDWQLSNDKHIAIRTNSFHESDKKIIATTDKSLVIEGKAQSGDIAWRHSLPQPSQSFIEKFVEEYNKGNVITDVMVEYHAELYDGTETTAQLSRRLKINPDNTINIKPIKDSWSISEVKQLCWQAFIHHKCIDGKIESSIVSELIDPFYDWLEENL